jgi:hypothetical protein
VPQEAVAEGTWAAQSGRQGGPEQRRNAQKCTRCGSEMMATARMAIAITTLILAQRASRCSSVGPQGAGCGRRLGWLPSGSLV